MQLTGSVNLLLNGSVAAPLDSLQTNADVAESAEYSMQGATMNQPSASDDASGSGWEQRRRRINQHIEDAAVDLFAARGYHNVTVADVAEAAGVGVRTVARYFPQKQDLLLARPRDAQARTLEALPRLAGQPDPLSGMIEQYQRLARIHAPDIPRFDAWTRAIVTAPDLWGKVLGENLIVLEQALASHVADALGVGVDDDVRPRALAAALLAAVDAMNRFKAGRDDDVHVLLDTVIRSLRTDFAELWRAKLAQELRQLDTPD